MPADPEGGGEGSSRPGMPAHEEPWPANISQGSRAGRETYSSCGAGGSCSPPGTHCNRHAVSSRLQGQTPSQLHPMCPQLRADGGSVGLRLSSGPHWAAQQPPTHQTPVCRFYGSKECPSTRAPKRAAPLYRNLCPNAHSVAYCTHLEAGQQIQT